MGKGEKTEVERKKQRTKEQRSAVDVLLYMLFTFAVFHLERSELNTDAYRNAVEVNAVLLTHPKQSEKEYVKKRRMSEQIQLEKKQ